MRSCLSETPPSSTYVIIPSANQQTQLLSDYGAYRSAVRPTTNVNAEGKRINPNVTNSIGANDAALRFQRSFLLPGACPGTINNPTGLPIPLSVLRATNAGFDDENDKPGLGPLVLNLGPLR